MWALGNSSVTPEGYQFLGLLYGGFSGLSNFARFKQPELAATLRRIAGGGEQEFYQGRTADLLVAQMKSQDPMNPQSDTQMAAQMAQFTSLQQASTMSSNIATMFGAEFTIGLDAPQLGVADPAGTHLLVLARKEEGYHRLASALTAAQLAGGEKGRPTYDLDELAATADGAAAKR